MGYVENEKKFNSLIGDGLHCSQCVADYWADKIGIDKELALRMTSGLGAGVNYKGACGAITATAVLLGLVRGFSEGEDANSENGVESLVKKVEAQFKEENGSLDCRELLDSGSDDPWKHCGKYCADAVKFAAPYLEGKTVPIKLIREDDVEEQPVALIGAGSGAAGLVVGAAAAGVVAYERRRNQNESAAEKE